MICHHCLPDRKPAPLALTLPQSVLKGEFDTMPQPTFAQHFAHLPDPRVKRTRRHQLLDLLVITLCAVICGVETWEDIEQYARAKKSWLQERLGLSLQAGIPSDDTLRRLFAALDPDAFATCFRAWVQTLREQTQGEVIALDGKTLRHSFDTAREQKPLHLVSAFATLNRLVLACVAVEDKSNEIPAAQALLRLLDLRGSIVTADAMHCQTALVEQIVEQEGYYVLCVKNNQPHLYEDVVACVDYQQQQRLPTRRLEVATTKEVAHGRREVRRCTCVFLEANDPDWADLQQKWPGLRCLIKMQRQRGSGPGKKVETHYYLSSLATTAAHMAGVIRQHWLIENQLHHVLDVSFGEDASRVRRDHGPVNLAMVRHVALNLLRREESEHSIKGKRKMAGWDNDFLLRVLVS